MAGAALAASAPPRPGTASPSASMAELLDPAAVARHACGPVATRRAEAPKPAFQLAAAQDAAGNAGSSPDPAPPLFDDLGTLSWPVTTRSGLAQRYFDQGLRLAYGFNHDEARRAFQAAQRADPGCALCYWGESYVLGPNINHPMEPEAAAPAFAAAAKAQALAASASPREQALIRAVARRYATDPAADRQALDGAYADAMAQAAASFPDDDNVQALFAEALMDLSPWDYWTAGGTAPKGRTAEIVGTLETVLKRDPDHPGAIHLYIHAVEASATPGRAEAYADRLAALGAGTGHLRHMPSHIYVRVGRYRDSLRANQAAVKADEAQLGQARPGDLYPWLYYPHNVHFVLASAQMSGDGATALEAAARLDRIIAGASGGELGIVEPLRQAAYFAHAQFSDPATVLALPPPPDAFPFLKVSWRYARALAQIAQGDLAGARAEAAALDGLADPAADFIVIAREVVAGRLARALGRPADAALSFARAVEAQDRLPYTEPPPWYYPIRQSLAAAQLAAGRTDDAIRAFRDSLARTPGNPYALYGLAQALKAKGMTDAAAEAERRFRAAWLGPEAGPSMGQL